MVPLKALWAKAFDAVSADAIPDGIFVRGLAVDSRKVERGDLFIAIKGVKTDGNAYIEEALRRGAAAVVIEGALTGKIQAPAFSVADARLAVARLAAAFYDHPSREMCVIGITGTNGKTTSSYLIEHILLRQNRHPGIIGTVNYRCETFTEPAVETTPGPLKLQQLLSRYRESGCRYVAMEVSAHALDQKRIEGVEPAVALFTNLTQDHLDYFSSLKEYGDAKARLFESLGASRTAVLNADDPFCGTLKARTKARVISYGLLKDADLKAADIQWGPRSTVFTLQNGKETIAVESPLVGLHNIYNVLGAMGVLQALGLDLRAAALALKDFPGVPGRLEPVRCGQEFSVFIDYAHTPDGLEKVLASLEPLKKQRLFVVFGCGGDRDRDKRPKMAAIASRFCDHVYLTSDNPRSEDPGAIAREIQGGFPVGYGNYTIVLDRKKAIRQALLLARRDDIVLLAGKGHETTQIIGDRAIPFSEREVAEGILHGR